MSNLIPNLAGPMPGDHSTLRPVSGFVIFMGILSIIVGTLALSSVYVATMASVFVFGWLLVIEGVFELIHGIMVRNWRGFALHFFSAAVHLLIGIFMLEDPVRAATVLTLLIAAYFFVSGLMRIMLALSVQFPSWPWVALNGAIQLALGVLIWRGWPESSLRIIGLFVGIDLIIQGWSTIALALAVRRITPSAPN